jgi:outer membrane protein assembly factor BamB
VGSGGFSLQVDIPASALPGKHVLKATGQTSGLSATASFLVRTNWSQYNNLNTRANPYENILNAQDVSNLTPQWLVQTQTEGFYTAPAIYNGIFYINDFDGGLEAYNASTGAFLWRVTNASANLYLVSSPTVANGIVYFGGDVDGKMYAFNATTGALLWTYTTGKRY